MNLFDGLAWLMAFASRRKANALAPDLADMGTAFGLDASMAPETRPEATAQSRWPTPDNSRVRSDRLVRRPQR